MMIVSLATKNFKSRDDLVLNLLFKKILETFIERLSFIRRQSCVIHAKIPSQASNAISMTR